MSVSTGDQNSSAGNQTASAGGSRPPLGPGGPAGPSGPAAAGGSRPPGGGPGGPAGPGGPGAAGGQVAVPVIAPMAASSSSASDFKEKDRFDGTNYTVWALRMSASLKSKELWDVVSGTLAKPADLAADPVATALWVKANNQAIHVILGGISSDWMENITQNLTAKELWEELTLQYSKLNMLSQVAADFKLRSLRMRDGDTAEKHVGLFRAARIRLHASGDVIADFKAIGIFLSSLPPAYRSFVSTQNQNVRDAENAVRGTANAPNMNINELYGAFLQEKASVQASEQHRHRDKAQALFADRGKAKKRFSKPFGPPKPSSSSDASKKKPGNCRWCGLPNHWERDCRKKAAGEPRKVAAATSHVAAKKTAKSSATILTVCTASPSACSSTHKSQSWYLDSGASSHICHNRQAFSTYKKLRPGQFVMMGNDSNCAIRGIGDVPVVMADGSKEMLENVLYAPGMSKNLVSVRKFCRMRRHDIKFSLDECILTLRNSTKPVSRGVEENDLYRLDIQAVLVKDHFEDDLESADEGPEAHISSSSDGHVLNTKLWHLRLGHPHERRLKKLPTSSLYRDGIKDKLGDLPLCEACVFGKQKELPFKNKTPQRAKAVLELVHVDICGPISGKSFGGAQYFITFIDDYSRYSHTYILKHKSEAYEVFVEYLALVKRQTGCKLKVLRSDNGGEFISNRFQQLCIEAGILQQFTVVYTSQQNGVVEKNHQDKQASAKSMLYAANLPIQFWAEAIMCATNIMNRLPTSAVDDMTPYEAFTGRKPSISHFRTFGCTAYAFLSKHKRRKFQYSSRKLLFIGYSDDHKAFKLCNPTTGEIVYARSVIFDEAKLLTSLESRTSSTLEPVGAVGASSSNVWAEDETDGEVDWLSHGPVVTFDQSDHGNANPTSDSSGSSDDEDTFDPGEDAAEDATNTEAEPVPVVPLPSNSTYSREAPRRSLRTVHAPVLYDPGDFRDKQPRRARVTTAGEEHGHHSEASSSSGSASSSANQSEPIDSSAPISLVAQALQSATVNAQDPLTLEQAFTCPQAEQWKASVQDELQSLKENGTWRLTDLPPGRKAVDCKWVFKTKLDQHGQPARYKTRLVARGFTQQEGVDYSETFAPVAKFQTLRTLLALAAHADLELHQLDVKTAFLHGLLEEDIYMNQPPGFAEPGSKGKVCKLLKTIYGLKQSPRAWNQRIHNFLIKLGFVRSEADVSLYTLNKGEKYLYLVLYVDDMTLATNCLKLLHTMKGLLKSEFQMTDVGEVTYTLAFHVKRNRFLRQLSISQEKILREILHQFNMQDCKPCATPMVAGQRLTKDMCPKTQEEIQAMVGIPYRQAVGKILYAGNVCRPETLVASGNCSQFLQNPGVPHWLAVKRVIRYFSGTLTVGITYTGQKGSLLTYQLYCNSDYAADTDTRRSISAYVGILAGGPVDWQSKKQQTVALSTTEAEYKVLTEASKAAIWARRELAEMHQTQEGATEIFCDNQGAVALARNPVFHARTRHIEVQYHFIREVIDSGQVTISYVPTENNPADILTKPLARDAHERHMRFLSLIPTITEKLKHSAHLCTLMQGGLHSSELGKEVSKSKYVECLHRDNHSSVKGQCRNSEHNKTHTAVIPGHEDVRQVETSVLVTNVEHSEVWCDSIGIQMLKSPRNSRLVLSLHHLAQQHCQIGGLLGVARLARGNFNKGHLPEDGRNKSRLLDGASGRSTMQGRRDGMQAARRRLRDPGRRRPGRLTMLAAAMAGRLCGGDRHGGLLVSSPRLAGGDKQHRHGWPAS